MNDESGGLSPMGDKKKTARSKQCRVLTIIGIVLCVLLIPMLVINVTMIVNSFVHKDEVPSFFGLTPMIVLTESMEPEIKAGDLIVCKPVEASDIKVGDVISFFDPMSSSGAVVTHRVIEILETDGKLYFRTMGDNNDGAEDPKPVAGDKVVGLYSFRIGGLGSALMFMQSTPGLIVCIGVPLVLLIAYELIRRMIYEKSNRSDVDQMRAELEALKAEKERLEAEKQGAQTQGADTQGTEAQEAEAQEAEAQESAEDKAEN